MNDDFRVGIGVKAMALPLQQLAKRFKVVNLAIEDNPDRTVLVVNGLVTAIDVDDAQPAHSQNDVGPDVIAVVVRTAMHHGIAHGLNFVLQYWLPAQAKQTRDSTHTETPREWSGSTS